MEVASVRLGESSERSCKRLLVIQGWVRKGLLPPVERGGPGRSHWFKLDAPTKKCLMEAKRKGYCRADRKSDPQQSRISERG